MTEALAGFKIGLLASSASRLGAGVAEAMIAQAAMIRSLGGEAAIFALEDRHSEDDRARYAPSPLVICKVAGPAQIGFAPRLVDALLEAELDCLHQQGIWMYPTRAGALWARRTRKPYIISPHGMLDPWITARGKWKKALARIGYERNAWRRAHAFHALSRREAADIRRESDRDDSIVIPNASDAPLSPPPGERGANIVFISRIHPKKNVLALVEAWRLLDPGGGARLTIAGWGEDGHVAELRAALIDAPASVEFIGPVYGAAKHQLLETARFMVLPSHSEGLPIAILEAWAAGTPAIMTGECNLPEGFAEGAAIECGYDPAAIASALERGLALTGLQWLEMAKAAQRLVAGPFSAETVSLRWAEAYRKAILGRA
jgi:glycosyltransferase involved in cell wall biosynthesis